MAKKYNCTINGIQYFKKSKVIGHDIKGKPIRKYFYGDGEKDADRQIEEFMNKIKSGLNVNVEALTVEQAMYQWLFDVRLHSKKIKSASFFTRAALPKTSASKAFLKLLKRFFVL